MQTIGLIDGISWASSSVYYEMLHRGVRQQARRVQLGADRAGLGRLRRGRHLQRAERWDDVAAVLAADAVRAQELDRALT